MITGLPPAVRWRVAGATLLLQAAFNTERRQGLGVAAALAPLARLFPDAAARRELLLRHLENFNTNPVLAGPLLGAVMRLEEDVLNGDSRAGRRVTRIKSALEGPLAALGDALFWTGLRPAVVLWGGALALVGGLPGLLVPWSIYVALQLGVRVGGTIWAYGGRGRIQALIRSSGLHRAIRWTRPVAASGALVQAITVLHPAPMPVASLGLIGALAGILVARRGFAHGTRLSLGCMMLGLILAFFFGRPAL